MLHTLTSHIGLIFIVAVCALVLAKGGAAERIAILLVAASWGSLLVYQSLTRQKVPEIALLASDFVVAVGFLTLAIRYGSLWLGVGMLFEGLAFAAHLIHLTELDRHDSLYALSVKVLGGAVLATIGGAALVSWRDRTRENRADPPNAP